jgi:hypothetical protein
MRRQEPSGPERNDDELREALATARDAEHRLFQTFVGAPTEPSLRAWKEANAFSNKISRQLWASRGIERPGAVHPRVEGCDVVQQWPVLLAIVSAAGYNPDQFFYEVVSTTAEGLARLVRILRVDHRHSPLCTRAYITGDAMVWLGAFQAELLDGLYGRPQDGDAPVAG